MVTKLSTISSEIEAHSPPASADEIIVKSADGQVSYRLRLMGRGLWLQRERCRQDRFSRLVQTVIIADSEQFNRWCEADNVRFDYPLVFDAFARAGRKLLHSHGQ